MPRSPRPRREVSLTTLMLMKPLLRYSVTRRAYVLRGVGGRYGPVFRQREDGPSG
jgi:hypothetical protein